MQCVAEVLKELSINVGDRITLQSCRKSGAASLQGVTVVDVQHPDGRSKYKEDNQSSDTDDNAKRTDKDQNAASTPPEITQERWEKLCDVVGLAVDNGPAGWRRRPRLDGKKVRPLYTSEGTYC